MFIILVINGKAKCIPLKELIDSSYSFEKPLKNNWKLVCNLLDRLSDNIRSNRSSVGRDNKIHDYVFDCFSWKNSELCIHTI